MYPPGDTLSHMSIATAKKTAYIRTRVRPQIKKDAERVLGRLGISTTDAISVYLRQIALQGGLPFEVKVPNETTRRALTQPIETMKSYDNVDKVFEDILGKKWRKKWK